MTRSQVPFPSASVRRSAFGVSAPNVLTPAMIGTMAKKHVIEVFAPDVTIDNIHFTCCGGNAVGNRPKRNFEVRNCIFNHLGGSVLLGWAFGTVRFGNAVEIWDGVDGYRVHDNWMYQIYDTGITHQCHHDKGRKIFQSNVEYARNLVEYCFWSIEYYNAHNLYGETRNVFVHDNFCRFGGYDRGCQAKSPCVPVLAIANALRNLTFRLSDVRPLPGSPPCRAANR